MHLFTSPSFSKLLVWSDRWTNHIAMPFPLHVGSGAVE